MYPHRWYIKQLLKPKITDFDTSYIISAKRRLNITIPITKKYYGFNVNDLSENRRLNFSPNTYYHVGFHFSNVLLTFGFASTIKFGANSTRGNTTFRDIQFTVIGRRIITDINYQNYKGFFISNAANYNQVEQSNSNIIRPDIRVISFGIKTMFVYNYKKYSLRGAFSFTDIQRKSAASFMTGIYHSNVVFQSIDSTIVKYPFNNYFSPLLNQVNKISLITVGVSAGYGYTFVYKKFIFSTAINIGLGGQETNYTTIDKKNHSQSIHASVNVNARSALRYDNLRFFYGTMGAYENNFIFNSKEFNTENYIAKLVVFAGYRFNAKQRSKKILKALRLIDYN
ncbi:MAG TPA: DUF4421 family protein [Bacteroidia bacterium]